MTGITERNANGTWFQNLIMLIRLNQGGLHFVREVTLLISNAVLKAKLPYAKAVYGKPFKYNSMKIAQGRFPKEVISIKTCKPKK